MLLMTSWFFHMYVCYDVMVFHISRHSKDGLNMFKVLLIVVIFALSAEAAGLTADRKRTEKRREVEAEDEHAEGTAETSEEPGESQELETTETRPRRSGLTGILSRKERAVIKKRGKKRRGKKRSGKKRRGKKRRGKKRRGKKRRGKKRRGKKRRGKKRPPKPTTPRPTTNTTKKPEVARPTDNIDQLNCNFERRKSLCGWSTLKSDPLRWKWLKAKKSRWSKADHTTGRGKGSYAYLYTFRASKGSKGSLTSPLLPAGPPTGRCLTFFYNMYQTNGFFKVIMKYDDGNNQTVLLREGGQGDAWLKATVSLLSKKPYWIVLEHTRGKMKPETGLAIDDIVVTNKQCPSRLNSCGTNIYGDVSKRDLGSPLEASSEEENRKEGANTEENEKGRQKRILGGKPSRKGEFPWIVHLRTFPRGYPGPSKQCGGSIIDEEWILTAAHCFELGRRRRLLREPRKVRIYLGEHNTGLGKVEESQFMLIPEKIIHHPDRVAKRPRYDLTLLKLKYKLTFTDNVNAVCLPSRSFPPGTPCIAAGWGVTDSGGVSKKLLHLSKVIQKNRRCTSSTTIRKDMLCAISPSGVSSVCKGDSGGPLMCKRSNKYELAGATSFGSLCRARKRTSAGYANIYYLLPWIKSTIA